MAYPAELVLNEGLYTLPDPVLDAAITSGS
jgi:hypothetical protein